MLSVCCGVCVACIRCYIGSVNWSDLVFLGTGVQLHSSGSHLERGLNSEEESGSRALDGSTIGVGVI